MRNYFLVFLGAGLGGAARHACNTIALHLVGVGFPLATLCVNVIGSTAMGALIAWFSLKADPGHAWRLFLTTGVLGGFTTFSAFSLDAVSLYERGEWALAAGYVTLSVTLALLGLYGGLLLIRSLA